MVTTKIRTITLSHTLHFYKIVLKYVSKLKRKGELKPMTLQFIPFDRHAAAVTAPYFAKRTDRLCDRTVGVNFMWRTPFQCAYAIVHDCLILRVNYGEEGVYFTYPISGNVPAALQALYTHCEQKALPMRLATLTDNELQQLTALGYIAESDANRDYFDYLYHYTDLASFAGRRYSAQRNHINRFIKQWSDWQYHELMPEDVPSIKAFLNDFIARKTQNEVLSLSETYEMRGCMDLLDVMHDFGMRGGYLTVENTIVAFSIGEIVGDTLYVHVEKGNTDYPGVYQLMVREFAAHNASPAIHYINREDDSGDLGLRQSKLAYRPCALLEKNQVLVKQKDV